MFLTRRIVTLLAFTLLASCTTHSLPMPTLVRFTTELGVIDIAVRTDAAPISCENFLRYVDAALYDGGQFHRAVRLDNQLRKDVQIEVVQAGADRGRRRQGFAPIALERTSATGLMHLDGTISMARGGIDTATSDFFICVGPQPSLDFGGARNGDGQGFAAFGSVVAGMDVVRKIQVSKTQGENLTPVIRIQAARRLRDGQNFPE